MSCAGNSAWWIWGRIQTLMSNVWPKDGLLPSHAADIPDIGHKAGRLSGDMQIYREQDVLGVTQDHALCALCRGRCHF